MVIVQLDSLNTTLGSSGYFNDYNAGFEITQLNLPELTDMFSSLKGPDVFDFRPSENDR